MWFVSKKKYNALLKQKEELDRIATNAVTQNGRLIDEWGDAIEEMKSIQKLNYQLVERNEELITRIQELEAELYGVKQDNQQWVDDFEDLDLAYGCLKTDYDKLCEERDHYKDRCQYLENKLL